MQKNEPPEQNTAPRSDQSHGTNMEKSLENTQYFTEDSSPSAQNAGGSQSNGPQSKGVGGTNSKTPKSQQTVGGYSLIRLLGEGGMGRVFQASDESGRMVAIKLLSPELSRSPEALERFKMEGVIASAISHPHCVFVHRADEDNGTPFIAMELMTGLTLKDLVAKRGPLPTSEAVCLVLQCIDGLIEAHSRGMIHRDVKPANCYLDDQGNVKIGDFGLARSLVSDSELTRTGAFLGTPLYASPEQILGETVDEQSDIYSLAATLYFLLAGKAPFESPNAPQVIAKIVSADPPLFAQVGIKVPKKLEQVVLRGLARDRSKRYESFEVFRDELARTLETKVEIGPLPRRALAYVIDAFIAALVVALFVFVMMAWGDVEHISSNTTNIGTLWQSIYYFVLESVFGTTIGKKLVHLRVVSPETGGKPSWLRCLVRTLVFVALMNAIEFAGVIAIYSQGLTPATAPVIFAISSWGGFFIGCLAILSVWWSKRTQLLYEWVSNTQTWTEQPNKQTNNVELVMPGWTMATQSTHLLLANTKQIGRFDLLGAIVTEDDSHWLSAHDSTIDRSVWIEIKSGEEAPPSESREKCVRRTRMRFLDTGVHEGRRWNAYVAPDGAPISTWFDYRQPMPWPVAQRVFRDAAEEILAAESSSEGDWSSVARWWLNSNGKLTLADAPVKISDKAGSTYQPLFVELASLALPDKRGASKANDLRNRVSRSDVSGVPPWRATQFLMSIKDGRVRDPALILSEMEKLSLRPSEVSVTMRVVHATILAFALLMPFIVLAVSLMVPACINVVELKKESQTFATLAGMFRMPKPDEDFGKTVERMGLSKYFEPDRVASIDRLAEESYLEFRKAYDRLGFIEHGFIEQQNRIRGRQNFLDRPSVVLSKTDEENQRDEKLSIGKGPKVEFEMPKDSFQVRINETPPTTEEMLESLKKAESKSQNHFRVGKLGYVLLVPFGMLVLWGGMWRGGITHWLTSIAVVRRDGRRGAIGQCLWRTLLFWLPFFLIVSAIFLLDAQGTQWIWWTQQLRRCFLVLPLVYVIGVVLWPQRGPHDWASGTYVVPR